MAMLHGDAAGLAAWFNQYPILLQVVDGLRPPPLPGLHTPDTPATDIPAAARAWAHTARRLVRPHPAPDGEGRQAAPEPQPTFTMPATDDPAFEALLLVHPDSTILIGRTPVPVGPNHAWQDMPVEVTLDDDGTGVATVAGIGVLLDRAQVSTLAHKALDDDPQHPARNLLADLTGPHPQAAVFTRYASSTGAVEVAEDARVYVGVHLSGRRVTVHAHPDRTRITGTTGDAPIEYVTLTLDPDEWDIVNGESAALAAELEAQRERVAQGLPRLPRLSAEIAVTRYTGDGGELPLLDEVDIDLGEDLAHQRVTVYTSQGHWFAAGTHPDGQIWTLHLPLDLDGEEWFELSSEAAALEEGPRLGAIAVSRYLNNLGQVHLLDDLFGSLGRDRAEQRVAVYAHPDGVYVTGTDPVTQETWNAYLFLQIDQQQWTTLARERQALRAGLSRRAITVGRTVNPLGQVEVLPGVLLHLGEDRAGQEVTVQADSSGTLITGPDPGADPNSGRPWRQYLGFRVNATQWVALRTEVTALREGRHPGAIPLIRHTDAVGRFDLLPGIRIQLGEEWAGRSVTVDTHRSWTLVTDTDPITQQQRRRHLPLHLLDAEGWDELISDGWDALAAESASGEEPHPEAFLLQRRTSASGAVEVGGVEFQLGRPRQSVTIHAHEQGTVARGIDPGTEDEWREYLHLDRVLSEAGWAALRAEAAAVEAGRHPEAVELSRPTHRLGTVCVLLAGPSRGILLQLGPERGGQRVTLHIHPDRTFAEGIEPDTGEIWEQYVELDDITRTRIEDRMDALRGEQYVVEQGPRDGSVEIVRRASAGGAVSLRPGMMPFSVAGGGEEVTVFAHPHATLARGTGWTQLMPVDLGHADMAALRDEREARRRWTLAGPAELTRYLTSGLFELLPGIHVTVDPRLGDQRVGVLAQPGRTLVKLLWDPDTSFQPLDEVQLDVAGWAALEAEHVALAAGRHPEAAALARRTDAFGGVEVLPGGELLQLGPDRANQDVIVCAHPERTSVIGVEPETGQWVQHLRLDLDKSGWDTVNEEAVVLAAGPHPRAVVLTLDADESGAVPGVPVPLHPDWTNQQVTVYAHPERTLVVAVDPATGRRGTSYSPLKLDVAAWAALGITDWSGVRLGTTGLHVIDVRHDGNEFFASAALAELVPGDGGVSGDHVENARLDLNPESLDRAGGSAILRPELLQRFAPGALEPHAGLSGKAQVHDDDLEVVGQRVRLAMAVRVQQLIDGRGGDSVLGRHNRKGQFVPSRASEKFGTGTRELRWLRDVLTTPGRRDARLDDVLPPLLAETFDVSVKVHSNRPGETEGLVQTFDPPGGPAPDRRVLTLLHEDARAAYFLPAVSPETTIIGKPADLSRPVARPSRAPTTPRVTWDPEWDALLADSRPAGQRVGGPVARHVSGRAQWRAAPVTETPDGSAAPSESDPRLAVVRQLDSMSRSVAYGFHADTWQVTDPRHPERAGKPSRTVAITQARQTFRLVAAPTDRHPLTAAELADFGSRIQGVLDVGINTQGPITFAGQPHFLRLKVNATTHPDPADEFMRTIEVRRHLDVTGLDEVSWAKDMTDADVAH
jgi:hypothetical protein